MSKLHQAEPYCKKCRSKLILNRIEIKKGGLLEHFFHCKVCNIYISESDNSKMYWSNYEWLYIEERKYEILTEVQSLLRETLEQKDLRKKLENTNKINKLFLEYFKLG